MFCTICLEVIKSGEGKVFSCGHVFHGLCAEHWFREKNSQTCPSCRSTVDPSTATTLFIATDDDTPDPPCMYAENRRKELEDLRTATLTKRRELEVMRNELRALEEELRRAREERQELPPVSGDSCYDSLTPIERKQLLTSYHNHIEELRRQQIENERNRAQLEQQLVAKLGELELLNQEKEELRETLAFFEETTRLRSRISANPSFRGRTTTTVGPRSYGASTSSEAGRWSIGHAGATARVTSGAAATARLTVGRTAPSTATRAAPSTAARAAPSTAARTAPSTTARTAPSTTARTAVAADGFAGFAPTSAGSSGQRTTSVNTAGTRGQRATSFRTAGTRGQSATHPTTGPAAGTSGQTAHERS